MHALPTGSLPGGHAQQRVYSVARTGQLPDLSTRGWGLHMPTNHPNHPNTAVGFTRHKPQDSQPPWCSLGSNFGELPPSQRPASSGDVEGQIVLIQVTVKDYAQCFGSPTEQAPRQGSITVPIRGHHCETE